MDRGLRLPFTGAISASVSEGNIVRHSSPDGSADAFGVMRVDGVGAAPPEPCDAWLTVLFGSLLEKTG
jgi:hypothetical protein